MNFVFISPHFPENYWNFCDRLRANGVNVLGIGDAPYETLPALLKSALTEYYRVDNMENYDEMLRAMGFFTFKYGKIDWVESNNEYWLEQDARLRTDFNITTGIKSAEIEKFKRKSVMKTYYQKAGIPTARWCVTADVTEAQAFAKTVGWPVIAKPDNGVGANGTHKFKNKTELNKFFQQEGPNAANYILEEFVDGEIVTFDGVADANAEPIYAASHITPDSIMEIAHGKKPMWYYVAPKISPELRKMGEAALKAFGAKSRFFHLEFFRLKTAKPVWVMRGISWGWKSTCARLAAIRWICSTMPAGWTCTRFGPIWWHSALRTIRWRVTTATAAVRAATMNCATACRMRSC